MALYVLVAAYNEADLIGPCVDAVAATGIGRSQVHVFDGAWTTSDGHQAFDDATDGPSTDDTLQAALDAGAQIHTCDGLWPSQAAKRTAMFHEVDARRGDQLLVLDADERLMGDLGPLPQLSAGLLAKYDVGEIDLPGIRRQRPHGDWDGEGAYPLLRLFQWRRSLRCVRPGWYETSPGRRIVAYRGRRPALPIIKGLWFEHEPSLRSPRRIDAKRAYYEHEHPLRAGMR